MTDRSETTVLVVDDEEPLAELYTAFLEDTYSVRTATSGEEALEVFDQSVDIVLLDRRMPGLSGDDVLSEIRAIDVECQVAMLTAVEPAEELLEFAIDDYRTKPVESDELHRLVESLRLRAEYDDESQRYFALASKLTALKTAGKTNSTEYGELAAELRELQRELDSRLGDIGPKTALKDLLNP